MRPGRGGAMALENDEPLMEPVLVDGCLILCLGDETLELAPFEKFERRVFRKVDFSGVSLMSCTFTDVIFEDCRISAAEFSHASFARVTFTDCDISDCSFLWANLDHTSFLDCSAHESRFTYAVLNECALDRCDMSGVKLDLTEFKKCRIRHCSIDRAALIRTKLLDCILAGVRAEKEHIRMFRVWAEETTFVDCRLTEALVAFCEFRDVTLLRSNFWKAAIKGCQFHNSALHHTGFNEARIYYSTLISTGVSACRFRLVNAEHTLFENCRLAMNLFEGADLRQTVFYDSELIHNFYGEDTSHPTKF